MNTSKKKKITAGIICAAAAVFAAGFIFDKMLTVTNYTVKSQKTGSGTVRIVNVSDLHNCSFGKEQSRLIEAVRELSPDIIVMTGDAAEIAGAKNTYDFIGRAAEIAPVYYSAGNHENRLRPEPYKKLMDEISKAGAVILDDEIAAVTVGENIINIIGLDDDSLNDDTLKKLCDITEPDLFTVVLAHNPNYIDNYTACSCDLVLCGHAHGGQIRIPFTSQGIFAPDQGLFPKYTQGCFTENGTSVIISRGVGNKVPCPRFFNLPEIVAVDIVFGD